MAGEVELQHLASTHHSEEASASHDMLLVDRTLPSPHLVVKVRVVVGLLCTIRMTSSDCQYPTPSLSCIVELPSHR